VVPRVDLRVLAADRLLWDTDQVRRVAPDRELRRDEDVRGRELLEVRGIEQDETRPLLRRRERIARVISVVGRNPGGVLHQPSPQLIIPSTPMDIGPRRRRTGRRWQRGRRRSGAEDRRASPYCR